MSRLRYAISVVQKNGNEDYLRDFMTQRVSVFPSRAAAERQKDFMLIGMAGDVQSINIVKHPGVKA